MKRNMDKRAISQGGGGNCDGNTFWAGGVGVNVNLPLL